MNDISQFLVAHGGPILFAVVFVEQAGLPLPSAPWLLAAGALSASGKLNPALAIMMSAMACVIADSLWFYVGRRGGNRVLRVFCRLSLAPNSCVRRTKGLFARHGLQGLVAAKFLPGLGTVMPPLAGALGVSAAQFVVFDSLGSLFYSAFYVVTGFLFQNQIKQVLGVLNQLGFSVLLLALVLVPTYIGFKYVRRRRLVIGPTHHTTTEREETRMSSENSVTARAGAHPDAAPMSGNNLDYAEFQNVTLALAGGASKRVPENPPAPLVQPTPCEL